MVRLRFWIPRSYSLDFGVPRRENNKKNKSLMYLLWIFFLNEKVVARLQIAADIEFRWSLNWNWNMTTRIQCFACCRSKTSL
mmetsp:Transcript_13652/g.26067  ORF Transcript_13652/g.26067 Transcript_13652/m.26067 type:complete len:82 (+) Transcript_13652:209-454(+)